MKNIRFLPVIIYLLGINTGGFAATIINPGDVSGTWSLSESPYQINGNVTIPSGLTLSIEPGVQVLFQGYYSITVRGKILALGTLSSGILFTVGDTTGATERSTTDGVWNGIRFSTTGSESDTSRFKYCTMSYARNAINISSKHNVEVLNSTLTKNYGYISGAAIYINDPDCYFLVKDCLIKENFSNMGPAVYSTDGINVNILENEISYNQANGVAGAIDYRNNQGGVIKGNIIKFNTSGQDAGAINCRGENIEITWNIFHDNTGSRGGGIFFAYNYNSICENNTFINNTANWGGGIDCYESTTRISNNVICNNRGTTYGGGINIRKSNISLTGNTICNNQGALGGGLSFAESETKIYNSILWGNSGSNGDQVYIDDNFSSPDIYYSDIESGTGGFGYSSGTAFNGVYQNNIQTLPQFMSPSTLAGIDASATSADWSIQISSPCVNAGMLDLSNLEIPDYDRKGNPRLLNGRIDIGAYEAHIEKVFASGTIASNSEWIADVVEVTGDIYIPDNVTLRISPGTRVSFTGHYKIDVHGVLLAIGTDQEKIIFEIKDTLGFYMIETTSGSWDGIDFNNGPWTGGANGAMSDNDSSILRHCILQYAKSNKFGGAIKIDHFSRIRIEDCVIKYCGTFGGDIKGGGLYCVYGDPVLRNTGIENNFSQFYGSGIFMENSDMQIENCTITGNKSYKNTGAGIYMNDASPLINNTLISDNWSNRSYGYGGGIVCRNSNPVFTNCKVLNNRHNASGAAAYLYNGRPTFVNCLFANNYGISNGGIIYLSSTEGATFINNTIVSNAATAIMFDASVATLYNTIIWGNNQQISVSEPTLTQVDIYNSIIQNGVPSSYLSEGLVRHYINVWESDPQFINPSVIVGYDPDAIHKDYRVNSFSPVINAGTTNINSNTISDVDLNGTTRIIADSIDIGAFEHQGGRIVILDHPSGSAICEGESLTLSLTLNDTANVQWQKDGVDIPGANTYTFTIDSVTSSDQGNYKCLASNAYGITTSEQTTVFVTQLPKVQIIGSNPWFETGVESVIKTFAGGTNITFQWKKDGNIIPDGNLPEYHFTPTDSSFEGNYTCEVSNICAGVESDPVQVFLVPQLCMVTVSPTTGHNLIVWEKKSIAPVMAYNIYRESVAAGIYDRLATISYDDLSVFVDTMADPTVQAYLYKITALDTAAAETDIDLCKPHKTIHLLVTTNPELNTTQLAWDRYHGFEYQTYTIYRSSTGVNFDPVHSMSASLNSWTDPDPLSDDLFFRIAVEKPDPCIPEGGDKKAGTGPYYHSLSNMDDNKLKAGQQPPDTITLSKNSIEEETLPGTMIGKLFTEDKDSIDSHTYQFVPGDGDDNNISFTLLGDLLLASESFDFETKTQYSVRIRSTDNSGNYCEVPFIIQIIDVDETTGLPVLDAGAVKAFPNPFSQATTISFPNPSGESYRFVLTDLSGKVVRIQEDITTGKFILKREGLEKGMYVIELRGERTYRGKLVIE